MSHRGGDPELVLVEWVDSSQPMVEWVWLEDHKWRDIIQCQSVGWLVHKDKQMIVLAQNFGDKGNKELEQVSGVIRIPMRAVSKITKLC